jgi:hypothetical protein
MVWFLFIKFCFCLSTEHRTTYTRGVQARKQRLDVPKPAAARELPTPQADAHQADGAPVRPPGMSSAETRVQILTAMPTPHGGALDSAHLTLEPP